MHAFCEEINYFCTGFLTQNIIFQPSDTQVGNLCCYGDGSI
jgi:hypothetical protein